MFECCKLSHAKGALLKRRSKVGIIIYKTQGNNQKVDCQKHQKTNSHIPLAIELVFLNSQCVYVVIMFLQKCY